MGIPSRIDLIFLIELCLFFGYHNEPTIMYQQGGVFVSWNKKRIDILVKTEEGAISLLEVKGVNKQNDWLIGNPLSSIH